MYEIQAIILSLCVMKLCFLLFGLCSVFVPLVVGIFGSEVVRVGYGQFFEALAVGSRQFLCSFF
jgi:hypothetical protein